MDWTALRGRLDIRFNCSLFTGKRWRLRHATSQLPSVAFCQATAMPLRKRLRLSRSARSLARHRSKHTRLELRFRSPLGRRVSWVSSRRSPSPLVTMESMMMRTRSRLVLDHLAPPERAPLQTSLHPERTQGPPQLNGCLSSQHCSPRSLISISFVQGELLRILFCSAFWSCLRRSIP